MSNAYPNITTVATAYYELQKSVDAEKTRLISRYSKSDSTKYFVERTLCGKKIIVAQQFNKSDRLK